MQYNSVGEAARAGADAKQVAITDVAYELAPSLERPATSAGAWTLSLPTDARRRFAALATALGVRGEIVEQGADQLAIVDSSGKKAGGTGDVPMMTMWVGGGPASWSYYPAALRSSTEAMAPCAPDVADCVPGTDVPVAPTTTLPENLPSTSEATTRATEILRAAGYDVGSLKIVATTSPWSTTVAFEELIDATATGILGSIDFGADGVVSSAWGQFARYDEADTYPLVELETALDQIRSMTGLSTSPTDAAVDSTVPRRTVIVRITGVELVLQPLYTSQTEVHLVPSYRFTDGDGDVATVYAIPEKYIAVAEPSIPEPAPVEPGDGNSTPGSPGSGSSGSGGGSVDPGGPPSVEIAPIPEAEAATLVGLGEDEAIKVATSKGWASRVVARDGESFMVTTDFRPDRVNLTVDGGKVTSVSVG